jgi:phosphoadenosine phosphosulfate reductase
MTAVDLALKPPKRSVAELKEIVADGQGIFGDQADPLDLLMWFGRRLGVDRIAVAVSFSDGVMAYLAARALPGVDLLFGDTGYHFVETLGFRDAVSATQPVNVRTLEPELSVAEQNEKYGEDLWKTDPDKCCAMRKTAPMDQALTQYEAWATGLRRDDHAGRAKTPMITWDERHQIIKINPIAAFTDDNVEACIAEYEVMENPLKQLGYRSVGCEPCTRPVAEGEDDRAGRWTGKNKIECGLHI